MKHSYFKGVLCAFLILLCGASVYAQRITGKVLSSDNREPLPGATVLVKGTTRGSVVDATGNFSIDARAGETLLITYVGYLSKEVSVTNETNLEILLQENSQIGEVVVTALGFKKEKARLGYAMQEVKGDELIKAREPNAINSLTGKVSGLTIGASPELLGKPNISLRGSEPIFVVDGVPINSDTWNINADDIESITVLKGPVAAALYGFRSAGGVIMITTKKGTTDKRGVSIEFNSSQMIQSGFNAFPQVQDEYGPGDHGRYAFVDGRGGGANDGDYDIWGPRFEGQAIPQYDSPVDANGKRSSTPWVARGKDNLKRFLRPGFLSNNNISVSTSTDKVDLRYSTSYNYQQGIVPNTQLNVANFNVYGGLKFTDKLKLEANLNYNRQFTDNIPDVQYGPNSIIYNVAVWGGADWDVDQMRNYWQPGKEGIQEIYAEYQRYNNPWFMAKEWLRGHKKSDVYGQIGLSWDLAPGLKLQGRTAITTYDLLRTEKFPYSATVYGREEARGDYREDKRNLFENNTDLNLSLNKEIGDNFSVNAIAGGNLRLFKYNSSYTTTNYLNVPGLYNFKNSANPLIASNFNSDMIVQSGYYSVDFGFGAWLYLSHTGRLDHLSTLPKKSNLFYYPSVGLSAVISQLADLGPVSFLKLRGSFANVKDALTSATIGATPGADYPLGYGSEYFSSYQGPSYGNSSVYTSPLVYDNKPGSYFTNSLINSGLKPSSRRNYEGGLEAKFLHNRIGIDATYFQYIDGPQIFSQPISEASGYTTQIINALKVKRAGVEIGLSGSPFKNATGFSWDVFVNWSTYHRTLAELPEGNERYNTFFKKGDRLDAYYSSAFLRTKDGQIINDASGRPIINPYPQKLGYGDADWVWSLSNRFSWKSLSLGIQFDGRVGGVITDYVARKTYQGGRNLATTEGDMGAARLADWEVQKAYYAAIDAGQTPEKLVGEKDGHWVGTGVQISNGETVEYDQYGNIKNYNQLQFKTNTTKTFLQDYISAYYRTDESTLISKTFSKLREITLTYTLPQSWLQKQKLIQGASVSLIGRNLFYFMKAKTKDVDLDNYIDATGSGLQTPTLKSYGVNFNIKF